jgi:hypothetical protein
VLLEHFLRSRVLSRDHRFVSDFDKVMKGNPNVVGESKAFDWTYLDKTLEGSASRNMHAAWRVIIDFPGQPLKVPQYLLDAGVELRWYAADRQSPYYPDPKLMEAIEQFIRYAGKRYDGDKRLGFVQAGLLGFWGEFHTWGQQFITPVEKEKVVGWYASYFKKTQIQVRYPEDSAYAAGFGRHDDSFGYETLDGAANGNVDREWYFWPDLVRKGQSDYWKRGAMGGEVRGEIGGEIFEPSYNARTFQKQSFMECVNVTHTTWMFHHAAFREFGFTGAELANARFAHARMGYNFHVPSVSVKVSSQRGRVDVDVTVTQIGVAPFYYDLGLGLQCSGMTKRIVPGVDTLIDMDSSKIFKFTGVPATEECLNALTLSLESSYAYVGRPIKFAQGNGSLVFTLPTPGLAGEKAQCRILCRLRSLFKRW